MIRVFQTTFADRRTGAPGNSFSACVASWMEIPLRALPQTTGMGKDEAFMAFTDMLVAEGMVLEAHIFRPRGYAIETGRTAEGLVHSVITWDDGKVFHDPHPRGLKLASLIDLWTIRTIDEAYHGGPS